MARKGRGRLSGIELLPEECAPVVAWAAGALQKRDVPQTEIYSEFVSRLEGIEREHRGELEFRIPSFSAFNRYSVKLALMTSRINQASEIAGTLAEKFDAGDSDDLTLIAAETIKTLIFEILTNAGEAGIEPKDAMALANALRAATQAQSVSTQRREKIEKDFATKAKAAVQTATKAKGLSQETATSILSEILGVKTP
ncbi:DUF3486 family protein [Rhizobium halophytocola]|uniref:Flagellar hook-basal body complex protein FliE n=1 Tax=Rhizobium halophytocola TaxID=735519 RepID=A0ABS4E434_9HYPH|nr:DUF3486 family protein [Rhizobium halophytocola]MBP1852697.1 flagellar hook-basal body complex protein FliE [Rhizobium halophytocola]